MNKLAPDTQWWRGIQVGHNSLNNPMGAMVLDSMREADVLFVLQRAPGMPPDSRFMPEMYTILAIDTVERFCPALFTLYGGEIDPIGGPIYTGSGFPMLARRGVTGRLYTLFAPWRDLMEAERAPMAEVERAARMAPCGECGQTRMLLEPRRHNLCTACAFDLAALGQALDIAGRHAPYHGVWPI